MKKKIFSLIFAFSFVFISLGIALSLNENFTQTSAETIENTNENNNSSSENSSDSLSNGDNSGANNGAESNGQASINPSDEDAVWADVADKTTLWGWGMDTMVAFQGGDGTYYHPYEIGTALQLAQFAKYVNNGTSGYSSAYYRLTADINLSGKIWTPIGHGGGSNIFSGWFDGAGHSITGMIIDSTISCTYKGLFGYTQGKIGNLYVSGTISSGIGSYNGIIAGYIIGSNSLAYNLTANSTIFGSCYANVVSGETITKFTGTPTEYFETIMIPRESNYGSNGLSSFPTAVPGINTEFFFNTQSVLTFGTTDKFGTVRTEGTSVSFYTTSTKDKGYYRMFNESGIYLEFYTTQSGTTVSTVDYIEHRNPYHLNTKRTVYVAWERAIANPLRYNITNQYSSGNTMTAGKVRYYDNVAVGTNFPTLSQIMKFGYYPNKVKLTSGDTTQYSLNNQVNNTNPVYGGKIPFKFIVGTDALAEFIYTNKTVVFSFNSNNPTTADGKTPILNSTRLELTASNGSFASSISSAYIPKRKGYIFKGYATATGDKNNEFYNGGLNNVITLIDANGNFLWNNCSLAKNMDLIDSAGGWTGVNPIVNLYAIWEAETYNLTFDTNIPADIKEHYDVDSPSWFVSTNASNTDGTITYNTTWNSGFVGRAWSDKVPMSFEQILLSRRGFKFLGWADVWGTMLIRVDNSGIPKFVDNQINHYDPDENGNSHLDIKLYAIWEEKTYTSFSVKRILDGDESVNTRTSTSNIELYYQRKGTSTWIKLDGAGDVSDNIINFSVSIKATDRLRLVVTTRPGFEIKRDDTGVFYTQNDNAGDTLSHTRSEPGSNPYTYEVDYFRDQGQFTVNLVRIDLTYTVTIDNTDAKNIAGATSIMVETMGDPRTILMNTEGTAVQKLTSTTGTLSFITKVESVLKVTIFTDEWDETTGQFIKRTGYYLSGSKSINQGAFVDTATDLTLIHSRSYNSVQTDGSTVSVYSRLEEKLIPVSSFSGSVSELKYHVENNRQTFGVTVDQKTSFDGMDGNDYTKPFVATFSGDKSRIDRSEVSLTSRGISLTEYTDKGDRYMGFYGGTAYKIDPSAVITNSNEEVTLADGTKVLIGDVFSVVDASEFASFQMIDGPATASCDYVIRFSGFKFPDGTNINIKFNLELKKFTVTVEIEVENERHVYEKLSNDGYDPISNVRNSIYGKTTTTSSVDSLNGEQFVINTNSTVTLDMSTAEQNIKDNYYFAGFYNTTGGALNQTPSMSFVFEKVKKNNTVVLRFARKEINVSMGDALLFADNGNPILASALAKKGAGKELSNGSLIDVGAIYEVINPGFLGLGIIDGSVSNTVNVKANSNYGPSVPSTVNDYFDVKDMEEGIRAYISQGVTFFGWYFFNSTTNLYEFIEFELKGLKNEEGSNFKTLLDEIYKSLGYDTSYASGNFKVYPVFRQTMKTITYNPYNPASGDSKALEELNNGEVHRYDEPVGTKIDSRYTTQDVYFFIEPAFGDATADTDANKAKREYYGQIDLKPIEYRRVGYKFINWSFEGESNPLNNNVKYTFKNPALSSIDFNFYANYEVMKYNLYIDGGTIVRPTSEDASETKGIIEGSDRDGATGTTRVKHGTITYDTNFDLEAYNNDTVNRANFVIPGYKVRGFKYTLPNGDELHYYLSGARVKEEMGANVYNASEFYLHRLLKKYSNLTAEIVDGRTFIPENFYYPYDAVTNPNGYNPDNNDMNNGIVITLMWEAEQYKVSIKGEGGTFSNGKNEFVINNVEYDQFVIDFTYDELNLKRDGFTLKGYYVSDAKETTGFWHIIPKETKFYKNPHDLEIHAVWEWDENPFNVNLAGNVAERPNTYERLYNGFDNPIVTLETKEDFSNITYQNGNNFITNENLNIDGTITVSYVWYRAKLDVDGNIVRLNNNGSEVNAGDMPTAFSTTDFVSFKNFWENGQFVCDVTFKNNMYGFDATTGKIQNGINKVISSNLINVEIKKLDIVIVKEGANSPSEVVTTNYDKSYDTKNHIIQKTGENFIPYPNLEGDISAFKPIFKSEVTEIKVAGDADSTMDSASALDKVGYSFYYNTESHASNRPEEVVFGADGSVDYKYIKFAVAFQNAMYNGQSYSYSLNYNIEEFENGFGYVTKYNLGGTEMKYKGKINKKDITISIPSGSKGYFSTTRHTLKLDSVNYDATSFFNYTLSGRVVTKGIGSHTTNTVYDGSLNEFYTDITTYEEGNEYRDYALKIENNSNDLTHNFNFKISGRYTILSTIGSAMYVVGSLYNGVLNTSGNIKYIITSVNIKVTVGDVTRNIEINPSADKENIFYTFTEGDVSVDCFQIEGNGTTRLKFFANSTVVDFTVAILDDKLDDGNFMFYSFLDNAEAQKLIKDGKYVPQKIEEPTTAIPTTKTFNFEAGNASGDSNLNTIYWYGALTDIAVVTLNFNVTAEEIAENADLTTVDLIFRNNQPLPLHGLIEDVNYNKIFDGKFNNDIWNKDNLVRTGFKFLCWQYDRQMIRSSADAEAITLRGIFNKVIKGIWSLDNFTATISDNVELFYQKQVETLVASSDMENSAIFYEYSWYKYIGDGVPESGKDSYSEESVRGQVSSTLTLTNVSDSGYYRCKISASLRDELGNPIESVADVFTEFRKVTIKPRIIEYVGKVDVENPFDKVYDDTTTLNKINLELKDVTGDTLKNTSFVIDDVEFSGAYDNQNVGTNKPITITLFNADSSLSSNYVLSATTYSGNITKRKVKVSVSSEKQYSPVSPFIYDELMTIGLEIAVSGDEGLVSGYKFFGTFKTVDFANADAKNVGVYRSNGITGIDAGLVSVYGVTISKEVGGVDVQSNYDITYEATLTILKRDLNGAYKIETDSMGRISYDYDGVSHAVDVVKVDKTSTEPNPWELDIPEVIKTVTYTYIDDDGVEQTTTVAPIDVNEYRVEISFEVKSANYENILPLTATLEIKAITLNITLGEAAKLEYKGELEDGKIVYEIPSSVENFAEVCTINGLASNETVDKLIFTMGVSDVGSYTDGGVNIYTAKVLHGDREVSRNYIYSYSGTFSITKRVINVDIKGERIYDGQIEAEILSSDSGLTLNTALPVGMVLVGVKYTTTSKNVKFNADNMIDTYKASEKGIFNLKADVRFKSAPVSENNFDVVATNDSYIKILQKGIKFLGDLSQVYSGTDDLDTTFILNGIITGETLTYTAKISDKTVGTGRTITSISLLNSEGNVDTNYFFDYTYAAGSYEGLNVTVTKRDVIFNLVDPDGAAYLKKNTSIRNVTVKLFDGGYYISGLANGQSFSNATVSTSASDAGIYVVTPTGEQKRLLFEVVITDSIDDTTANYNIIINGGIELEAGKIDEIYHDDLDFTYSGQNQYDSVQVSIKITNEEGGVLDFKAGTAKNNGITVIVTSDEAGTSEITDITNANTYYVKVHTDGSIVKFTDPAYPDATDKFVDTRIYSFEVKRKTLKFDSITKVYDGDDTISVQTAITFVEGFGFANEADKNKVSFTGNFNDKNVGIDKVVSITLTGDSVVLGNYKLEGSVAGSENVTNFGKGSITKYLIEETLDLTAYYTGSAYKLEKNITTALSENLIYKFNFNIINVIKNDTGYVSYDISTLSSDQLIWTNAAEITNYDIKLKGIFRLLPAEIKVLNVLVGDKNYDDPAAQTRIEYSAQDLKDMISFEFGVIASRGNILEGEELLISKKFKTTDRIYDELKNAGSYNIGVSVANENYLLRYSESSDVVGGIYYTDKMIEIYKFVIDLDEFFRLPENRIKQYFGEKTIPEIQADGPVGIKVRVVFNAIDSNVLGTHSLTNATVADSNIANNYETRMTEPNDYYELLRSNKTINATISGEGLTKIYNGQVYGLTAVQKDSLGFYVMLTSGGVALTGNENRLNIIINLADLNLDEGLISDITLEGNFTLSGAKFVGEYAIASQGVSSPQFAGVTLSETMFKIEKKLIGPADNVVESKFNFTQDYIINNNTVLSSYGVVNADDVSIKLSYASSDVGQNIVITNIELLGSLSYNYKLPSKEALTGTIVARNVRLDPIREMIYGDYKENASIRDNSFTEGMIEFKVYDDEPENLDQDITVKALTNLTGKLVILPNSGKFIVGNYTIILDSLVSTNGNLVVSLNDNSFKILKRGLTIEAQESALSKDFDGTDYYDNPTNVKLNNTVNGDDVKVGKIIYGSTLPNLYTLTNETSEEGITSESFILSGLDKDNYIIKGSYFGNIYSLRKNITFDYDENSFAGGYASLVTDLNDPTRDFIVLRFPFNNADNITSNVHSEYRTDKFPVNPTHEGYTFKGWYYLKSDGTEVLVEDNASFLPTLSDLYMSVGNIVLKAKWEIKQFTVTVNVGEGGSVTINENSANTLKVDYYSDIKLIASEATGYYFTGYFNDRDESISTDLSYTFSLTKDTLVNVKFAKKSVNVILNKARPSEDFDFVELINPSFISLNGFSFNAQNKPSKNVVFDSLIGDFAEISAKGVVLSHYVAIANGSEIRIDPTKTVYEIYQDIFGIDILPSDNVYNLNIYAVWDRLDYTLTLTLKSDETIEDYKDFNADGTKVYEFYSQIGTLPTPIRAGYIFAGWSDGNALLETTSKYIYANNQALSAEWIAKDNTINIKLVNNQDVTFKAPGEIIVTGEGITQTGTSNEISFTAKTGTNLKIVVTPSEGFTVLNATNLNALDNAGNIVKTGKNEFTFTGFVAGANIEIYLDPALFTITIMAPNANLNVSIGDSEASIEEGNKIKAYAGAEVKLNVTPHAGYIYDNIAESWKSEGTGEFSLVGEQIVYSNFCTNSTILADVRARENSITINNYLLANDDDPDGTISRLPSEIEIDGASNIPDSVNGVVTFKATTGTRFNIEITLNNGYNYFKIASNNIDLTIGEPNYSQDKIIIEVSDYTADSVIEIYYKKVPYVINIISVTRDLQEDGTYIYHEASDVGGKVEFKGSSNALFNDVNVLYSDVLNLKAIPTANSHEFKGWYHKISDEYVLINENSLNESLDYTVKNAQFVYAIFEKKILNIVYKASENGNLEFTIGGVLTTGKQYSENVIYGNNSKGVKAVADEGYKFTRWSDGNTDQTRIFNNVTASAEITAKFEKLDLLINVDVYEKRGTTYNKISSGVGTVSVNNVASGQVVINDEVLEGYNYILRTWTANEVILQATSMAGYVFDSFECSNTSLTKSALNNDGSLVKFSGFIGGSGTIDIKVVFIPTSNLFNVNFKTTGVVKGGQINIDDSSEDITMRSQNYVSSVTFSALTGGTVTVEVNVRKGYKFDPTLSSLGLIEVESQESVKTHVVTILNEPTVVPDSDAYYQTMKFKITNYSAGANIFIKVKADEFEVRFINNNNLTEPVARTNVKFGELIDTTGLSNLTPSKANFEFGGWYIYEIGSGSMYVDSTGTSVKAWEEFDYKVDVDGTRYFNLYAYWVLLKTEITTNLIPGTIEFPTKDIVLTEENRWEGDGKVYLNYGTNIKLLAPTFEGYKFMKWQIVNNDNDAMAEYTNPSLNISSMNAKSVTINLIYFVKVDIFINKIDAGSLELIQDGSVDGYFDPTKDITLKATVNEGYSFKGFRVKGTTEYISNDLIYTLKALEPIEFEGIFEGDEVKIEIGGLDSTRGKIIMVTIAGVEYIGDALKEQLIAHIGDEIIFTVEANTGYSLSGWNNPDINMGRYLVKAGDSFKTLTFIPYFTPEKINITFTKGLTEELIKEDEDYGSLKVNGVTDSTMILGYEDTLILNIEPKPFYDFDSLIINGVNYSSSVSQNVLSITAKDLFNIGKEIEINVKFKRLYWSDVKSSFSGQGTEANPFVIRSVEELAQMAYLINNNESDGFYATAHYVLAAGLDFDGRFWTPIGTSEHPFSGHFDFKGFGYKNIVLLGDYEEVTVGGIFGVLKDAVIESNKETYVTVYIVVGSILGTVILVGTVFVIIKIYRKRKYGELARK